jgi:hypothetical protein
MKAGDLPFVSTSDGAEQCLSTIVNASARPLPVNVRAFEERGDTRLEPWRVAESLAVNRSAVGKFSPEPCS